MFDVTFHFKSIREMAEFVAKLEDTVVPAEQQPEPEKKPRAKRSKKQAAPATPEPPTESPVTPEANPAELEQPVADKEGQEVPPQDAFDTEKLDKPLKDEDLRSAIMDAFSRDKKQEVFTLLADMGVRRASELPKEKWAEFHRRCVDL